MGEGWEWRTAVLSEKIVMADSFSDREKGYEAKYQHDQEMLFKITARRNRLLGMWAADRMGMIGAAAESYAKDVIVSDFEEQGDADVVRKVLGDLTAKGIDIDEKASARKWTGLAKKPAKRSKTAPIDCFPVQPLIFYSLFFPGYSSQGSFAAASAPAILPVIRHSDRFAPDR